MRTIARPPLSLRLIACCFALASLCHAADQVRLLEGGSKSGKILKSTRDVVSIETIDRTLNVPVPEIRTVLLDEEPAQLTQARINIANGGYETALEKLAAVGGGANGLVRQDLAFFTAYCQTRLAIAGKHDAKEAGKRLTAFVRENDESFHYYQAVEALGDLLVSLGRHGQAQRTYAEIAKAPFPSLKARAALLVGKSLQAEGKHADAIRRFDEVLATKADDTGVAPQQFLATLAKGVSLAATGDLEGGLNLARGVARRAAESDAALNAAAYNALGRCYEAADRPKDALFAYLHIDLLFNSDPTTHAEALGRLAELWRTAGKPDAARDALARLRRQYAASPEARAAG